MSKTVKILRKTDIVLIVLMILSAIGLIFIFTITAGDAGYVRISVNGEVMLLDMARYDGQTIEVLSANGVNHVYISDGTARITHADCPDHLCVRAGAISRTWHHLACLPNQVAVSLIVPDPVDSNFPSIDVIGH